MTTPAVRQTARLVRERIAQLGVPRALIAEAAGLTERQMRRRLHAEVAFDISELDRIATALGCPLASLIGGDPVHVEGNGEVAAA